LAIDEQGIFVGQQGRTIDDPDRGQFKMVFCTQLFAHHLDAAQHRPPPIGVEDRDEALADHQDEGITECGGVQAAGPPKHRLGLLEPPLSLMERDHAVQHSDLPLEVAEVLIEGEGTLVEFERLVGVALSIL